MRKSTYPVAKPEDFNVSSAAIEQVIQDIRVKHNLQLHSFLMLRQGTLLWEEYFRDGESCSAHVMYSVSKSFTSTAIGMAQQQGLLSVDDKLYDFFPEHLSLCDSDYKRDVTLRHLLMMGSGFENNENDIFGSFKDLTSQALSQQIINKPGTVFNYYTLGSFLLSAVFSKVYPDGIHSYLRNKLFTPMGFSHSHWDIDANRIPMGGFGLFINAYDLTRLGQLYLQEGNWEGQQLVPKEYIKEATIKQIDNSNHPSGNPDWTAGYGYQFWQNKMGGYRADGMFGQYCIVLPEKQVVIVMTSHLDNMQIPLTAISDILLPAIEE